MASDASAAVREIKTISGRPGPRREHEHDEHSVAFVLKGVTSTRAGGARLEARAGQLVLIAAGVPHECRPLDPESCGYTLFLVVPGASGPLDDAFLRAERGVLVLDATQPTAEALAEACRDARHELAVATIEAALAEALDLLGAAAVGPRAVGLGGRDPQLAAVETVLRRSIARNASLDELSRRAGMGKYEFVRAFKAAYGLSPHAYLLNLRINEAKELLRSGHGLAEAALACGFCDQSHFTHAFTCRVGLSPAEYARMYKTRGSAAP